jgi:hypothetical protein
LRTSSSPVKGRAMNCSINVDGHNYYINEVEMELVRGL